MMRRYWIFCVACAAAIATLATCNVFTALTDCASSADCKSKYSCDLSIQRCVPTSSTADADTGAGEADTGVDGAQDSGIKCEDYPWGTPSLVLGLANTPIICARLSDDETTAFVVRGSPTGVNDIYTAVRDSTQLPFRLTAQPMANINEPFASEFWPTVAADGKLMFFESARGLVPDDAGVIRDERARIWSTSRVSLLAEFDKPKLQQLFDVPGAESAPYLHPNSRSLYFASTGRNSKGQSDIFVADINALGVVTAVRNVDGANTIATENAPVVTLDNRYLYFNRPFDNVDSNQNDVFMVRRTKPIDGFGLAERIETLSSDFDDYPSWVSPDHCRVYLTSTRPDSGTKAGDFRLWIAQRVLPN
jgi:hypothetical protein